MNIETSRFGTVEIEADDIVFFRNGLLGFEDCQHWVILADGENSSLAWLQSMQYPKIALPVVSPRKFVPGYQIRLDPKDVDLLQLTASEEAFVLAVVSRDQDVLTLNLRAPLIINLSRRMGSQIVTVDSQPLQYELSSLPHSTQRKSA